MKRIAKLLAMFLALCMFCTGAFAAETAATGGFQLKVTASLEGSEAEQISQILDSSFIQIAAATLQDKSLLDAQVNFAGMDLFRLLAKIQGDLLTVSIPVASQNTYSITSQRVQELLGGVLEQVSGALEESGVSMDQLQGLAAPQFNEEELSAAFGPYLNLISQFIQENMQASQSDITLEAIEKTVSNATVMTIEPDEEDFCNLFTALADQLENDENMEKVIKSFADYLRQIEGMLSAAGPEMTMEAEEFANELEQGFADLPSELRELVQDIQQNGMGGKITLTMALEESDLILIRFDVTDLESNEKVGTIGFEDYQDESGMLTIALYMNSGDEDYKFVASGTSSAGTVTGNMQVTINGLQMLNVIYNGDLTKQSMLFIPYGTCVITFQGVTLTLVVSDDGTGGNNHMIRVDGLEQIMGEGISAAVLNINTSTAADPQEPTGENIDISAYTMEELQSLAEELVGKYSEFLGGIFGGSEG